MQIRANANENQVISVSSAARQRAAEKAGKQARQQSDRKSIFAGDLGLQQDIITQRKQRAQKRALKIIGDAWNGDRKIDQNILDIRDRIIQLNAEKEENNRIIAEGETWKEALRQQYGVAADSQEQKDLELLEKEADAKRHPLDVQFTEEERKRLDELKSQSFSEEDLELLKKKEESEVPGSGVRLTEEEEARVAELNAKKRTEYQERCLSIDSFQSTYEVRNDKIDAELRGHYATVRAIKQERLKYHGMVDAQKKADEVLEAAGKEIFGLLIDEAKEHVEEELEKPREEAKEKAEEKEEQEEKIEERKEKQEELEERIDEAHEKNEEREALRREAEERSRDDADLLESMLDAGMGNVGNVSDVQSEIKNMLHKMKLLEEDIKGSTVDDEC